MSTSKGAWLIRAMKCFLVEGIVINSDKMSESMMKEHQAYTESAMKEGKILFSSLKSDMSASVTLFKAESEQAIWDFYNKEPFYKNEVLTYQISELQVHYHYPNIEEWFS